jgi:hypothetical protein
MAAENIGAGYRSLASVIAGSQGSAGHRENLLMPGVTRIGLAHRQAQNKYHDYWALVLAGSEQTTADPARLLPRGPLPHGRGLFVGR